ncbi:MAG TPA: pyridoxamine 5'-phosphate oxidase family protein [Myxococcales bacterium]|nr:pyridoxamine 5'-phosphate oxidase family protein [Myxococcales bacterium]HIM03400.1 pyridoxamine 5'-phosphate oxidase family protein [Myxococcales bacterium]
MGTNAEALKVRVAVHEEADAISKPAIGSKTHWNYTPEQMLVFRGLAAKQDSSRSSDRRSFEPAPNTHELGGDMIDPYAISTEAQLREILPEPHAMLEQKVFDHLDSFARDFVSKTPLIMVATSNTNGDMDVSPKGDAPGFVVVEDENTILIPERPGNKLAYGFRNILAHPRIGLIFVIPGVKETLRINGTAEITREPELLKRLSARNKPAILATRVTVSESFFHCGKAFIRSKTWKPDSWPKDVKANIGKQIAAKANADDTVADSIDNAMLEDYETGLY